MVPYTVESAGATVSTRATSELPIIIFDFINSDDGQKIIEKVGLVTPNK